MSESHKFDGDLGAAQEALGDLPWKRSAGGDTWVFDEKKEEYVPVKEGDYIVKVGNRFEVSEKKPTAKKATSSKKAEKKETGNDVPEAKPAETPTPDKPEDEVASTPNGATSF